jgi:hypothetical protein
MPDNPNYVKPEARMAVSSSEIPSHNVELGNNLHVSLSLCRQFFEGGLLKIVGPYSYSIPQ